MSARRRLGAAFASGLLLAAAFPPADLGPLALIALMPLLWAWRGAGLGLGAACGAVAGLVFFGLLVSWTFYFGAVAYLPFVLFLSSWWALGGAVVGWLDTRRLASPPVVAAVWVMIEAGRGRVPFGGFAWGEVGAAFHDLPVARSLAGWGGVALVSFVAVAFNGFALDAVLAGRTGRGRDLRRASTALAAGVALALAGHLVLPGPSPAGRLRAALVQGNDHNRELTPAELAARYLPRNHLRLAEGIKRPVDLVVFPESSLDADPRRDPFLDNALSGAARRLQAALLAGGNTEAPGDRLYNTVFLFGPGGERLPLVYRKQHLVPFGEFVPWREALSFIEALDQVPRDYAPGRRPTLFPVEGQRTRSPGDVPRNARGPGRVPLEIGVLICFESAFAPLARTYARDGAAALVVMTNNRSFRRSANSAQHLALSQMRAAETGRPVLHAGISGITGVIDAGGDLRARTSLFEPTVLEATVTATTGRTPYVAMGEWVLALAGTVVAGTVALALTRPRSRPTGDGRGGGS